MNNNTYILLARSIIDSDVFASQKLLKIWIWCLCKASFKDRVVSLKIGRGETPVKMKRGQFIFGRHSAEEELFIDGSTIYKSMQKLKELGNITIDSNNQYSIITISNYDTYQDPDNYKVATKEQPSNNQVTSKEQVSNTNKKGNKGDKDNKIDIPAFEDFKTYALENEKNIDLSNLKLKYKAWTENGWKDGNNKPIKNWKSKLLHTIPHIKVIRSNGQQEPARKKLPTI